jgi:hypothetical protein
MYHSNIPKCHAFIPRKRIYGLLKKKLLLPPTVLLSSFCNNQNMKGKRKQTTNLVHYLKPNKIKEKHEYGRTIMYSCIKKEK